MRKVTSFPLPPPEALEREYKAKCSTTDLSNYTVVEIDADLNIVCVRKFDPAVDNIEPIILKPVKPLNRNRWTV